MLKKIVVATLTLVFVLPSFAFGQTVAQEQSMIIKQLQNQIEALQVQIKVLTKKIEGQNKEIEQIKTDVDFTTVMQRGMTGNEIKKLQTFLKQFPDIYPEGLVTGYYGSLTETAVRKLQKKQGLQAVGIVGPKTLETLKTLATTTDNRTGQSPELATTSSSSIKTSLQLLPVSGTSLATTTGSISTATTTATATSTPQCSKNYSACGSKSACESAKFFWYTVSCHPNPPLAISCAASNNYCSIGAECSVNGWYSCRGSCYSSVEACLGQTFLPPAMPTPIPSPTPPPSSGSGASGVVATTTAATTTTPAIKDITAPVISNIQTSNIAQTTAVVSWSTNEVSTSDVNYSKNSSVLTLGTLKGNIPGNTTSHSITLSNLSASSTYYYLVVSKDESDNIATSSVNNFKTLAEPVVTYTTRTITATAGTGGTISPDGSVVVAQGTNKTFTITPNTGYTASSVLVDGVNQGAISTYTFSNVQTTHTISATFAQITHTITVTQGTNGTISPGTVSVVNGSSQIFTISPTSGYQIASVTVDDASQTAVSTYTFTNVTSPHSIVATFSLIPVAPPCLLTVSVNQTTPAVQNISPGQSAVSIVKFNITPNCNGSLNSFAVSLLPMPNGYQNISALRLYNDADGTQIGTTQTVTGASVNFASVNMAFAANQILVLKVVGDVSASAVNSGTVYGVFGGSSAVNGSGGMAGNNASGNIIAGNTLTIQTPPPACPEPYSFVKAWGTPQGSGDGQVNLPRGIAVDTESNVYVADTANHRIQKFNSNGTFLAKWGTQGSGNGQFSAPVDVAVDAQGNVYVADNGNSRIQKFDSNGTFLAKWGTGGNGNGQFSSPYGIGLDSSGNVYVADYGNNRIQKFDSNGTFLAKWGTQGNGNGQFDGPMDVTVDAQGNLYVADYTFNNRIEKFDSSGNYLLQWGGVSAPSGVVVDSVGNVFVAEMNNNYRISKFSSSGVPISHWNNSSSSGGQLSGPWRVAVDAQGNVYVAEIFPAHRIVKFAPCSSGSSLDMHKSNLATVHYILESLKALIEKLPKLFP